MTIIANELIFPIMEKACHASHFVVLPEGRVFCVCFRGSREGADDVRIFGAMRNPQDGSWSTPKAITEDDGVPHWNPVLFKRNDGAVLLFYKVGKVIPDWKTRCMISYDNCETWSDSFELVPGDDSGGRGPVRNKAIYLKDGSILAGGSTERGQFKCFFDRSVDGGKTWARSEDVKLKEGNILQPTIWESEQGVHALMRSNQGVIYRTDSPDGIQWCEPYPIDMPNNNSGIDLAALPDGRLVLCCNLVGKDWGPRTPISLYESRDNGKTFTFLTHLTTMPWEFSYPAMRYEDGCLHITYTWRRKTVQYFCLKDI